MKMKLKIMGTIALLILLGSVVFAADKKKDLTAEKIILRYLEAVQTKIGTDLKVLGYEGAIKRLHKLGEKYLLKNKVILHKKASVDYLKLDELKSVKIDSLKRIHWDNANKYKKGDKITPPNPETNKAGSLIVMFIDGGYGIPPYGRHTRATTWWNAVTAAKALRSIAFKTLLSKEAFQKKMMMEDLAKPKIYRLSSDTENPSIGFMDGKELLVIDLKYTDVGIYSMAGIRWVKLDEKRQTKK